MCDARTWVWRTRRFAARRVCRTYYYTMGQEPVGQQISTGAGQGEPHRQLRRALTIPSARIEISHTMFARHGGSEDSEINGSPAVSRVAQDPAGSRNQSHRA